MVLGLALLLLCLTGLILQFNAGQVTSTKMRLVNATDAAAYSAAIWRARILNFVAYTNRAIVAQEVAVAQAVTLASYARFIEQFSVNAAAISADVPGLGQALAAWAGTAGVSRAMAETAAAAEIRLRAADTLGYKSLLEKSQAISLAAASTFAMSAAANEVIKASDPRFFAHAIAGVDAFEQGFIKRYASDEERGRLKQVVLDSIDPFVAGRDGVFWPIPNLPGACFGIPWPGRIEKNGGTTLSGNGLERWEAADTASVHHVRNGGFLGLSCHWREALAMGWGAAEAAAQPQRTILEDAGRPSNNGVSFAWANAALASADSSGFDAYSGIARVHDLDVQALGAEYFPVRRIAIFGQVRATAVRTAEVAALVAGRLSVPAPLAGQKISAVSAAEIYFRRPAQAPERTEYANLFNPYWHVRLVAPTPAERAAAEALYVQADTP